MNVAALPGKFLICRLDDLKAENGVAPLGPFLRGVIHLSLWFVGLAMLVSLLI